MSGDKSFCDTNVLLYMHSVADPGKQAIAQQVFSECAVGRPHYHQHPGSAGIPLCQHAQVEASHGPDASADHRFARSADG